MEGNEWWRRSSIALWRKERINRLACRQDVTDNVKYADDATLLALRYTYLMLEFATGTLGRQPTTVAMPDKHDTLSLASQFGNLTPNDLDIGVSSWLPVWRWKSIKRLVRRVVGTDV